MRTRWRSRRREHCLRGATMLKVRAGVGSWAGGGGARQTPRTRQRAHARPARDAARAETPTGQLGLGTFNMEHTPQRIKALQGHPVVKIACGGAVTVGWHCAHLPNVLADRAGRGGGAVSPAQSTGTHSFAVTVSGCVWAWGSNQFGQLGLGDEPKKLRPTVVTGAWMGSRPSRAPPSVHSGGAGRGKPLPWSDAEWTQRKALGPCVARAGRQARNRRRMRRGPHRRVHKRRARVHVWCVFGVQRLRDLTRLAHTDGGGGVCGEVGGPLGRPDLRPGALACGCGRGGRQRAART